MKPNPEYIVEIQDIVRNSPFPNHMGMQLAEMDIGLATIELDLGNIHLQPFGLVHGGVVATMIDTATFWAVFMRIPEDDGLVSVDLKLNYLRPVIKGKLKAHGRSIHDGRSISYSEAKVHNENGELIAHGTSTLMVLPGKGIKTNSKKFL